MYKHINGMIQMWVKHVSKYQINGCLRQSVSHYIYSKLWLLRKAAKRFFQESDLRAPLNQDAFHSILAWHGGLPDFSRRRKYLSDAAAQVLPVPVYKFHLILQTVVDHCGCMYDTDKPCRPLSVFSHFHKEIPDLKICVFIPGFYPM